MKNTEIIYQALKNPIVEIIDLTNKEYCKICGKEIIKGIKAKDILSGAFTNYSECKQIQSQYICKECSYCIKDESLRLNSFIADKNNVYLLKKNDLENYLFSLKDYILDEFVIGITTSFKKHNSFRCKVNLNPNRYYIRQEDKEFIFDIKEMQPLYGKLNEAYLQFSKDELQTGQYNQLAIQEFGLNKFYEYENIFKRYRNTHQFNLLIYMMNSEKRNEYIINKKKEGKFNGSNQR